MGRKKVLEKRQARLLRRKAELIERSNKSEDLAEVRAINEQLMTIAEDLQDIADELEMLADDGNDDGNGDGGNGDGSNGSNDGEGRNNEPHPNAQTRGGNPMQAYGNGGNTVGSFNTADTRNVSTLDTMEYREAFATYIRTGEWNYEARADEIVTTSEVGKIIPNTIMNEFIKELKVYGNLYNKVRKLNIKGGVEFPIEDLVPVVKWITETTTSETQKAPQINTSVSFGYHICEARISQSLLSQVVSLAYLEQEIAKLLAEAFVKEFDKMIVSGSGSGQPLGILNDTRVAENHKITFTASEMSDWTKWRKKLFANIPIAYRGQGVMVMTANTWESYCMTMKDANNNPIGTETFNIQNGDTVCRFAGREVLLVEPDVLADFDTAGSGDAFALYFKPTDYAINSNMQVGFKRYYDEDNNKYVNKGLAILDGKLLDVNGVYILKK